MLQREKRALPEDGRQPLVVVAGQTLTSDEFGVTKCLYREKHLAVVGNLAMELYKYDTVGRRYCIGSTCIGKKQRKVSNIGIY